VPVPVAEQEINQPRGQERPGVDVLVLAVLQALEQVLRAHDLAGVREAGALVGRPLLDRAEQPAEPRPELSQHR
jgi:hypothetical protein